jgi:hypothetical protein
MQKCLFRTSSLWCDVLMCNLFFCFWAIRKPSHNEPRKQICHFTSFSTFSPSNVTSLRHPWFISTLTIWWFIRSIRPLSSEIYFSFLTMIIVTVTNKFYLEKSNWCEKIKCQKCPASVANKFPVEKVTDVRRLSTYLNRRNYHENWMSSFNGRL